MGGLITSTNFHIDPLLRGGSQEQGIRSGTEHLAGICALETSIRYINYSFETHVDHLNKLNNYMVEKLNNTNITYRINGDSQYKLPNTLNISFPGHTGESIMMNCDLHNISISTGSACATGSIDPSHVLLAMGQSKEQSLEACRISWGIFSTTQDIEAFISCLENILKR